MNWNRKLTEEEQRKWDDITLYVAVGGTLLITFLACALVDYDTRQNEKAAKPNEGKAKTESVIAPENTIDENTTEKTPALPVVPVLKPSS